MILEYITKYHFEDCVNILSAKDNLGYFSIKIDFLKLFETYPDVGDKVLCNPLEILPACNIDIIKAQQNILEQDDYKILVSKLDYYYLKRNVHARFFGLPVCPELHRTVFPKNVDLGCFLKVTGTVVRVTQTKMLEYQRKYVCVKCKHENYVEAQFENRYILKAPSKCGNPDRCKSYTFTQVNLVSREHCKDYQEIKIQEQVNKLSIGTIPGSMWVVLEDDLVDSCKPGDDVNICGTVRRRWRPSVQTKKSEVDLVFQANNLEVCNSQRCKVISTAPDIKECFNEYWSKFEAWPLKGRDQILTAVCPQVYGLHLVKLAVMLTVITGSDQALDTDNEMKSSQEDRHTTRVRGQCHLLLVGDPGTGKSQLLRAGTELSARSVFTSGAGSTRAGLTCAALREDGEWQLEAGALVLSDGGVCCIDEIGQLREHDRTAIHEAMEQQTISIAKAGIVCKLNTRCAVIAACNPKGRYETDQPLCVNVSLGTPLLSRFDLIFVLLDSKNKSWDKLVSTYILFGDSNAAESKKQWSIDKLQMYIGLVGPRHTEMTKTANIILQSYYMMQRKSEYRDPSRTTVRMLDSLVRLSQAHCRLMYRTIILPMDAIIAVSLVDLSMQDCTLNDTVDALHSTFQKYPDFEYLLTAKKLLARLNLYEIWQQELLFYGKLLQIDHKTLESNIEKGDPSLFAKYDNIVNDTVPLTASLVTSSYFNINKKTNVEEVTTEIYKENLKDNVIGKVSDKLAATLKKHATLNKVERTVVQKKQTKRKRKEVTVDTSSVVKKKQKRLNKPKVLNENDIASESEDEFDTSKILHGVPSVNDFFTDLGIDFKFNETPNQDDSTRESKHGDIICRHSTQNENVVSHTSKVTQKENIVSPSSKIKSPHKDKSSESKESLNSSRLKRLKQFQFVEKHDLSKYEEKVQKPLTQNKIKVEKEAETHENGKSAGKLQLSIFESAVCEEILASQNKDESIGSSNSSDNLRAVRNSQVSLFENSDHEEANILQNKIISKLETSRKNSSTNLKSLKSSQISIFESFDCDIDLDI